MKIVDDLTGLRSLSADICVIGAGPVGLSLALDLVRRGTSVVVLESGLRRPDKRHQDLAAAEPGLNHAPMSEATCRALGGTSWLWGGRCLPLDPIDFRPRDHIPWSGWPIAEGDVAPYHQDAARLLGCGSAEFVAETREVPLADDGLLALDHLERWSNRPNISERIEALAPNSLLTIVLDATVVDLELDETTSHVTGVVVASERGRLVFNQANAFVLAAGGIETTRLLLNTQARLPRLLGGSDGPLGRYYMGHVSGVIADIVFSRPASAELFDYLPEPSSMVRRRLTLDASAQLAARLPNIAFLPQNPALADPRHRSGLLSAVFLALSIPPLGRRFVAEAIRRDQVGDAPQYAAHLRNVIVDLPRSSGALSGLMRQRLIEKRHKPVFFLKARNGRYPLHYHAEQLPDPASRVSLADGVDGRGMRRVAVDLRYSRADGEGVARAHDVLDDALRRTGLGSLASVRPRDEWPDAILAQARDGFHQIGLTRMAANPRDGVVDPNCRVHGVENLFIAGSSVFCTSGQANPTFTAVTLALRLSRHLARLAGSAVDQAAA